MSEVLGHVMVDAVEEKCVLVGVISSDMSEEVANEYIDELEFLAETAGAISVRKFLQKLQHPNPRTYVGTGKLIEIRDFIIEEKIELVVFDDELSPSQLRNIEKELQCKILDRNILILDIFASRARSFHAKTQVELAQLQYMLPRLTRMWTHLERQKGGIGLRGPGESQIESDRRIIQSRISLMKERLKEIDKQMFAQRGNRGQLVRVALVGYTNVGKSTVMNLLAKSEVFAENKLFATLDTTVRKVVIENLPFLLTDTVGFIRKLPNQLFESFKSTLDEVREADLLIHVLDISHPNFEDQFEVVNSTLHEIENPSNVNYSVGGRDAYDKLKSTTSQKDKPTILVFNKIDAYINPDADDESRPTLDDLQKSWMSKMNNKNCVFISAQDKDNIDELKRVIYEQVKEIFKIRYPYNDFLY
ncbi:MAG: GTPase HflX [Bacteroidota bacterium]